MHTEVDQDDWNQIEFKEETFAKSEAKRGQFLKRRELGETLPRNLHRQMKSLGKVKSLATLIPR